MNSSLSSRGRISGDSHFVRIRRDSHLRRSRGTSLSIGRIVIAAGLLWGTGLAAEPLRVVTTTEDLAYIARRVGGPLVHAEALLRGHQDAHFADARPDFIVKMNRASVFIQVGLDLEVGWAPVLLRQSRNPAIQVGAPGFCDASRGVHLLEIPASADRSAGDLHAYGNPHYWPDPLNAGIVARNIRDTFVRVDPSNKAAYDRNYDAFFANLRKLAIEETRAFAPFRGSKVATLHREFSYLSRRFGFETAVSIEEKPGVPPSAAYLQKVVQAMRQQQIRVILIAPWNNPRYAQAVARQTGARVVIMPISVLSQPGITTYELTIRTMLGRLRSALQGK